MSNECDDARQALRTAESRLEETELAHEDAQMTRRMTESELGELDYDYDRTVEGAKGHDGKVAEAEEEIAALERELERVKSGDDINRDARISALEEDIRKAGWARHDAAASSEKAWARATEIAGLREAKLNALNRAKDEVDRAEGRVSEAKGEVDAAEREVARVCS